MRHHAVIVALLTALAVIFTASAAHTTQLVTPAGAPVGGWLQACVNRDALPTGVPVVTIDTTNPYNVNGTAYTVPGSTTVYLPAEWAYLGVGCGDLLHELGHQLDYWRLTDAGRAYVMHALHLRGDWRQDSNSPHEQFAELYRIAATHARLPRTGDMAYGLRVGPVAFLRLRGWLLRR